MVIKRNVDEIYSIKRKYQRYINKYQVCRNGFTIDFTPEHVKDRNLIIKMLKYENNIILSQTPDTLQTNFDFIIDTHKRVLANFGFNINNYCIQNYRKIFSNYYRSPTNYDREVLDSVVYTRENKCVYYTRPILNINDKIPNISLYDLDKSILQIYDLFDKFKYGIIVAFSTS